MGYRSKYLISIYDNNDQLVTVLDNAKEFASFTKKTPGQAKTTLSKLFRKQRKGFFIDKNKFTVSFIQDN